MNIEMTPIWDKVFPQDPSLKHSKVAIPTHFGTTLAADVYEPADAPSPRPAIAVSGPFGAVKEQSSGLYAQELARRGFLTIAFDPSFTGESSGVQRYMNSPDINTEDFQAAVDYLVNRSDVTNVGLLGVCGWGGVAINTAAIDTRVKATVASTMYNMSEVAQKGYFDEGDSYAARHEQREALNAQRTRDFATGSYARAGGVPDEAPAEDAPEFLRGYYNYYKTERGYHARSLNSNGGWAVTAGLSLLNTPQQAFAHEIATPVLLVHGSEAHSRYFSERTYERLTAGEFADNKELLIIDGATHTDLYDQFDAIPFDKLEQFYAEALGRMG